MPFDSFFSSANKHHYVRSEKYEAVVMPEVNRVLALPQKERAAYISALNLRANKRDLSYNEKLVLRKLQFIFKRKHVAIQRRLYWKRVKEQRKKGMAFFSGFNTASR